MKEPHGEEVATHTDPEPCAVVREGVRIPAKAITWSGDGDRSSERSDALLCSPQPPRFTVAASYCGLI